jgi:hypothetical protein
MGRGIRSLLEPSDIARSAAGKQVLVRKTNDGEVVIERTPVNETTSRARHSGWLSELLNLTEIPLDDLARLVGNGGLPVTEELGHECERGVGHCASVG